MQADQVAQPEMNFLGLPQILQCQVEASCYCTILFPKSEENLMDEIDEPKAEESKEDHGEVEVEEEPEVVVHQSYTLSLLFPVKLMDENVEHQSFVFMFVGWYDGKKESKTMRVKHTRRESTFAKIVIFLCSRKLWDEWVMPWTVHSGRWKKLHSLSLTLTLGAASMGDPPGAYDSTLSTLELTHGGVPDHQFFELKSFPRAQR